MFKHVCSLQRLVASPSFVLAALTYTSHRGIGCHKCNHCVSSINAIHQGLGFLFFVKRIYSCREWKSDFKFFSSGMKGTDAVLMNQKWLPWGMKKLLGKRYFFFFFLWWQMVQILKYLFLQLYIVFQDNFAVSTLCGYHLCRIKWRLIQGYQNLKTNNVFHLSWLYCSGPVSY